MKKSFLFITLLLCLFSQKTFAQWEISDDYTIYFDGSGAEGTFEGLQGSIVFNPDDLEKASFAVTLDPSTIETGNNLKNKHARGDKWFDVEQFSSISFNSSQVQKTSDDYWVTGDLTLHGITHQITIPFTFDETESGGLFKGKFTLNRENFGIMGPMFGFLVGEEFKVEVEVPVKHKN